MEDPTGFLKHSRSAARKQAARQRIRHWHEYEEIMPPRQAGCQATRCMACATPDCHSYCPVHNLIPDWNELVHDGHWHEAWRQLESTNNFPEFTGRLCPAPCEDACTLKLVNSPVTIRAIELAIVEHAWERGWIRPQRSARKLFKRVAVIGSGPAGLACAQQLARAGYRVTVYEKSDRAGGLLRYGIPDFRLDKRVLDRRLQQLQAEGVMFRNAVHVGVDLAVEELRRSAHAIVLACGSETPRNLEVPGRRLGGIHFAMDYLRQQNHRLAGGQGTGARVITACNKDVAVIGGGDTGSDCVGADVLDYWPEHVPQWHETDHDAEGCGHVWGYDTVAFEGLDDVTGLVLQQLRWQRRADGGWDKRRLPGQARHLPAQLVLLALGYAHPVQSGPLEDLGLELDRRGTVRAPEDDYQSSLPGVFACGDVRRGQSLIVWAIREGRQCARAVDEWLSGGSDLPRV